MMPGRTHWRVRWLLLPISLAVLCGCSEIRLREAMGHVQLRYNKLQQELEAGANFASRDAATELERALMAPAIAERSPHAGDKEFDKLLKEAIGSTQRVRKVAERFDREALSNLRGDITSRCDACHKAYRHP